MQNAELVRRVLRTCRRYAMIIKSAYNLFRQETCQRQCSAALPEAERAESGGNIRLLKHESRGENLMKAMRGAAMLCAACLIGTGICSLPAPAAVYAAEEETAPEFEGLRYETADGAVTITGFTSDLTGKVTVPAEIDGLPVTKIGEGAFKYNFKITEVTLPDSITELGKLAFKSCGKMTKATLPKNLTAIPESCFEECRKLESLVIPEPVKSLGELAFAQCLALADLTVPEGLETVGEDAFLNTPWLEAKRAENPFVIINHVLIDGKACSGDITIPSDVTVIGPSAFAHDYYLKNVLVPENVKEIARLGFFNCTGLESITVLNPECKIYDIDGTISNIYNKHQFSFMGAIRGYENSSALPLLSNSKEKSAPKSLL